MPKYNMSLYIRKSPKDPNMFEFIIATPTLKSQFILPRTQVNKLRIMIEKALVGNQKQ